MWELQLGKDGKICELAIGLAVGVLAQGDAFKLRKHKLDK